MKNATKLTYWLSFIVLIITISIVSCDNNIDPDTENPTTNNVDADLIANSLILKNASQFNGGLPTVNDGGIEINVKDTIYLLKGYSFGNRLLFKNESNQHISGFYIYVKDASFHFDVPKEEVDGTVDNDTISAVVLDLDLNLPNGEEVAYPFSADIVIQPHDDTGMPLDEFEETVTVEEEISNGSFGDCNDIFTSLPEKMWYWQYTIRENSSGSYLLSGAHLLFGSKDYVGGCCNDICNCTNWAPFNGCNDQSDTYKKIEVFTLYEPIYDVLFINRDNSAKVYAKDINQTLDRNKTNVCETMLASYNRHVREYEGSGTHNFSQGANTLRLDFPGFSSFAKPPVISEIAYSCHTLILKSGSEGDTFYKVYEAANGSDPFNPQWFIQ